MYTNFYFLQKRKMPVFADLLPEPGELGYVYPTNIYTPNTMEPRMMWTC